MRRVAWFKLSTTISRSNYMEFSEIFRGLERGYRYPEFRFIIPDIERIKFQVTVHSEGHAKR